MMVKTTIFYKPKNRENQCLVYSTKQWSEWTVDYFEGEDILLVPVVELVRMDIFPPLPPPTHTHTLPEQPSVPPNVGGHFL